jgi:cardiolipin synthase
MAGGIWTIPNGITGLRALGIPLFLWVYLGLDRPGIAFTILALGAFTDYLDGKLARALHQESALGAALDPAIDRLYILSTLLALADRQVISWVLVGLLAARDLGVGLVLLSMKRRNRGLLPVTYLGKAATFNLLYAFPLLLLGATTGFGRVARICGWSFAIWGVGLYLLTGLQYAYSGLSNRRTNREQ